MRVQLIHKLADHLDGVDVSPYQEGDVIDLPREEAELLLAERWVQPLPHRQRSTPTCRAFACEAPLRRRTIEQLRRAPNQLGPRRSKPEARRRAEDRIREELHDSRARTIVPEGIGTEFV